MKTLRTAMCLLMLGLFTTAACGGSDCATIEKKLCEGKDEAFCKKAKEWLHSQEGPDGKPMKKSEINLFCKMMDGDADLDAWIKGAQASISAKK